MRQRQPVRGHVAVSEHHDVEVQRPRSPSFAAQTALLLLDQQELIQQLLWVERGLHRHHLVEVVSLRDRSKGRGFFDARHGENA